MPSWKELKRFCDRDDWEQYKKTTDHYFYRKRDSNGNVRRVKVSKNPSEIHYHMWQDILKQQLQVTIEYFNKNI